MVSRRGRKPHHRHDRQPPRLGGVAPARLGRADRDLRRQGHEGNPRRREGQPAHRRGLRSRGRRRLVRARARRRASLRPDTTRTITRRSTTFSTSGSIPARPTPSRSTIRATFRVLPASIAHARRRRPTRSCISKAPTSIAAGSIPRCWNAAARAGARPYDAVLTHGFVLDEKGQKMSKSLGNVIAPQTVIKDAGADILRLWVAASDYSDDLRIGPEILKTFVETYRKLRNTIRWMLGSLAHYDPRHHSRHRGHGRTRKADAASARRTRRRDPRRLCSASTISASSRGSRPSSTPISRPSISTSARTRSIASRRRAQKRRAALEAIEQIFRASRCGSRRSSPSPSEEAWLSRYPGAVSVHLEGFPEIPSVLARRCARGKMGEDPPRPRRSSPARLEIERAQKRIGSSLEAAPMVFIADAGLRALLEGGRFRRNLHHLGYRHRGGRGTDGRVPARRCFGGRRRAGSGARAENARGRGKFRRSSGAILNFPT